MEHGMISWTNSPNQESDRVQHGTRAGNATASIAPSVAVAFDVIEAYYHAVAVELLGPELSDIGRSRPGSSDAPCSGRAEPALVEAKQQLSRCAGGTTAAIALSDAAALGGFAGHSKQWMRSS